MNTTKNIAVASSVPSILAALSVLLPPNAIAELRTHFVKEAVAGLLGEKETAKVEKKTAKKEKAEVVPVPPPVVVPEVVAPSVKRPGRPAGSKNKKGVAVVVAAPVEVTRKRGPSSQVTNDGTNRTMSQFIKDCDLEMKATEVVKLGKEVGLEINIALVYGVRNRLNKSLKTELMTGEGTTEASSSEECEVESIAAAAGLTEDIAAAV